MLSEFLYESVYSVLTALTALFVYCGWNGIDRITLLMAAVVLIPAVSVSLALYAGTTGRLVSAGLVLADVLLLIFQDNGKVRFFTFIKPYILELILLAVISYVLARLMTMFYAARYAALGCLLILTGLVLYGTLEISGYYVFPAVFLGMLCVSDNIQGRWKREGDTDKRKHMIAVLPFMTVIVLTASLIHYPDKPYDWKIVFEIKDALVTLADIFSFNLRRSTDVVIGFSDSGTIITDVKKSDRRVLSIDALTEINGPVYLTGCDFETFDGRRWDSRGKKKLPGRSLDFCESIAGVHAYTGSAGSFQPVFDYCKTAAFRVEYLDEKSKYLFAPSKVFVNDVLAQTGAREKGNELGFRYSNPYHLSLTEKYYRFNTDNPGFYDYMKRDTDITESDWNKARVAIGIPPYEDGLEYSLYDEYKKSIYDSCLQNIRLSEGVSKKLDELFAGADSSYEKLKRLEAAFQEMEYSLDPPAIPDTVKDASGYLDFFLLDCGEGFCSYYATAFALVARSMGLPSRYVQGYRVYIKDRGHYVVKSNLAHAWPEVYFEGKGWIAFEPTPGFYRSSDWMMSSSNNAPAKVVAIKPVFDKETGKETAEPSIVPVEDKESGDVLNVRIDLILKVLVSVILFAAFILLTAGLWQRRKFKKMDDRNRFLKLARDNMNICRIIGLRREENETLSEFGGRIETKAGRDAACFITEYERLLYAGRDLKKIDMEKVLAGKKRLLGVLKREKRLSYAMWKLFWGQFG